MDIGRGDDSEMRHGCITTMKLVYDVGSMARESANSKDELRVYGPA